MPTSINNPTVFQVPPIVQLYLDEVVKPYAPNAKLVLKLNSNLMKAIGWIFKTLKFNPLFMTNYFTTIGQTIYLPESISTMDDSRFLQTVIHEGFHMRDEHRLTKPLYVALYLGPQIFSLLSVLAFFNPWFLLCLLFLAPIPSPGRFWLELRAYRTSILYTKLTNQTSSANEIITLKRDWISEQLTEKFYYFCWPFKFHVASLLQDESFLLDPHYKPIKDFLVKHNANL